MDVKIQDEMDPEQHVCPECGSEESGYFCRNCGALLRGGEMVLCPRCHQIVPEGEFCNRCGQNLSGIALRLRQLAQAGDAFWVTTEAAAPPEPEEVGLFEPDETVTLASADLPDWLQELSTEASPPDVEARIYPSLQPIASTTRSGGRDGRFLILAILLAGAMLVGLVLVAFAILLRGG